MPDRLGGRRRRRRGVLRQCRTPSSPLAAWCRSHTATARLDSRRHLREIRRGATRGCPATDGGDRQESPAPCSSTAHPPAPLPNGDVPPGGPLPCGVFPALGWTPAAVARQWAAPPFPAPSAFPRLPSVKTRAPLQLPRPPFLFSLVYAACHCSSRLSPPRLVARTPPGARAAAACGTRLVDTCCDVDLVRRRTRTALRWSSCRISRPDT